MEKMNFISDINKFSWGAAEKSPFEHIEQALSIAKIFSDSWKIRPKGEKTVSIVMVPMCSDERPFQKISQTSPFWSGYFVFLKTADIFPRGLLKNVTILARSENGLTDNIIPTSFHCIIFHQPAHAKTNEHYVQEVRTILCVPLLRLLLFFRRYVREKLLCARCFLHEYFERFWCFRLFDLRSFRFLFCICMEFLYEVGDKYVLW